VGEPTASRADAARAETAVPGSDTAASTEEAVAADAEPDETAREAAFAAIEAAARAAEAAGAEIEPTLEGTEAAEVAEAAVEELAGQADELETLDDALIAARLGLLGSRDEEPAAASEPVRTQVAVVGLVSVASIAAFKRQLAHAPGVQAVGVSSGPSGEFLFTVTHDPELDLAAVVPGLPGFGARVTDAQPGRLAVTAHDPDLSA
jgi:hypothetical protein